MTGRRGHPARTDRARWPASAVPRPPAPVRRDWADLAQPTPEPGLFEPAMADHLPEPVRRWLRHAIGKGVPLHGAARLRMHGRIRLGSWWPFEATQILRPPTGFIWAAKARVAHLPVAGFDRYSGGDGQMRWRLLGALPVMSAGGPDITRSAAGRLASEFVLVPATALSPFVTWEPVDGERAVAHVAIGGSVHAVTLTVAPSGALTTVTLPRWGDPGRGPFGEHRFGVVVHREADFGGCTVPASLSAGWWYGTDRWPEGEFIRFQVDHYEHF
ncbi:MULTISPECIES: DUF6544 family protein [Actinomadura]|uniref:Uncharacterized protein n=1 Tax=Actinomadura litoris TaxID=2678616 RepID=A0A7K1L5H1_9ACTN|nr:MULTISPECIES: DUF6544 family protein [Actinomadura]MBT2212691.1 hypothetical protein [Actinomadura sp. NEAU-AAG7]MUN39667.1 hypothetical protein [Actinomadura litoris]